MIFFFFQLIFLGCCYLQSVSEVRFFCHTEFLNCEYDLLDKPYYME